MFVREIFKAILSERASAVNMAIQELGARPELSLIPAQRYAYATRSGRRFRPLLTLVSCDGVGGDWKDAVGLAVSVELLHKASLLHDDLVDQDRRRRGVTAFWAEFGSHEAVIMGDLLVALAFSTGAEWAVRRDTAAPEVVRGILESTLHDLALGEMLDLAFEQRDDVTQDDVVQMLRLKSGSLIAASLELGGVAAGAEGTLRHHLNQFGGLLGTVFQMINDINNITGLDEASKGSRGQDLERGKKTLPTLALRAAGIDLNDIASIEQEELAALLEPAQIALDETRNLALSKCMELPNGQMRVLFSKLLEHAQDAWFWAEQDG